jgi:hypothetical protein
MAQTAPKRIAVPAAFGFVAAVLFLVVVIPLFATLFFWLTSLYGPTTAALVVAAVALVLGLMALLPLTDGPRAPHTTTRRFASLARTEAVSAVRVPAGGRARNDGARLPRPRPKRNSAPAKDELQVQSTTGAVHCHFLSHHFCYPLSERRREFPVS